MIMLPCLKTSPFDSLVYVPLNRRRNIADFDVNRRERSKEMFFGHRYEGM